MILETFFETSIFYIFREQSAKFDGWPDNGFALGGCRSTKYGETVIFKIVHDQIIMTFDEHLF